MSVVTQNFATQSPWTMGGAPPAASEQVGELGPRGLAVCVEGVHGGAGTTGRLGDRLALGDGVERERQPHDLDLARRHRERRDAEPDEDEREQRVTRRLTAD